MDIIDADECAQMLKCSVEQVEESCREGELPGFKQGRGWLFVRSDLLAFLAERARQRDTYLDRHGITFTLGERERPLPMDLVPRLISGEEWTRIESGVVQRLRALEQQVELVGQIGRAHV